MAIKNSEIAYRLKEIRLLSDVTLHEMAQQLDVTDAEYAEIESGNVQITVSMLLDACDYLKISMTELLTGEPAKLHIYSLVKKNRALSVERTEGYTYENLAYSFSGRKIEPLLVYIEPDDANNYHFNEHDGHEFHYCLEGRYSLKIGSYTVVVEEGDSVYFDSSYEHGMIALNDKKAKLLVITI